MILLSARQRLDEARSRAGHSRKDADSGRRWVKVRVQRTHNPLVVANKPLGLLVVNYTRDYAQAQVRNRFDFPRNGRIREQGKDVRLPEKLHCGGADAFESAHNGAWCRGAS